MSYSHDISMTSPLYSLWYPRFSSQKPHIRWSAKAALLLFVLRYVLEEASEFVGFESKGGEFLPMAKAVDDSIDRFKLTQRILKVSEGRIRWSMVEIT
jgi:hypothetical protein